ncbi:MAG: response regulator transcription factor [Steroidobacteraceae bacterium]
MIAVVDDEESVRKAVVRLLRSAGHTAQGFASGSEFLQCWPGDKPDCLMLDLQMPGLSGTEVQRALNRAGAHLPVIVMTANDAPGAREECMREGAVAYLSKPVDVLVLLDAVDVAIGAARKSSGG